jgi:hypothetical protein
MNKTKKSILYYLCDKKVKNFNTIYYMLTLSFHNINICICKSEASMKIQLFSTLFLLWGNFFSFC